MSDSLKSQIRDYFAHVDKTQGAVDIDTLLTGHSADQPVQPLQPMVPPLLARWGWAVALIGAATIAVAVLVPLLLFTTGDEPDVATSVPVTTEPPVPTSEATTTTPEAATTVPDIATTTTTAPVATSDRLELRGDGIGVASFGDDDETVIAAVTAVLGEPWFDSGYVPSGLAEYCGRLGLSRIVRWGTREGGDGNEGTFTLDFVREPVRTVAGDHMNGLIAYTSSAITPAGDGSYFAAQQDLHPWLPTLDELGLYGDEKTAVAHYGDSLSEPTRDEDDGIPPVIVSRHLDLDGPWPVDLTFWDGRVASIGSGACAIYSGLVLDGNGIGIARFGDDPETVIAAVSRVLGPPTEDTGFLVDAQVAGGFCGPGRQRAVSWGDFFTVGFVDEEIVGLVGFISYAMYARMPVDGEPTVAEVPWPVVRLPMGVGLLDTESWARTQFGVNLTPILSDEEVFGDSRWAFLDLGGPLPVELAFNDRGTDRITAITSDPCAE